MHMQIVFPSLRRKCVWGNEKLALWNFLMLQSSFQAGSQSMTHNTSQSQYSIKTRPATAIVGIWLPGKVTWPRGRHQITASGSQFFLHDTYIYSTCSAAPVLLLLILLIQTDPQMQSCKLGWLRYCFQIWAIISMLGGGNLESTLKAVNPLRVTVLIEKDKIWHFRDIFHQSIYQVLTDVLLSW